MYPAHLFIFGDMVRAIAKLALSEPDSALPRPLKSAPAKDSTVSVPPQRLQLWFNEVVPLGTTRVRVTPAVGTAFALAAPTRAKAEADSPVEFEFSNPLADGRYTVDWATASADGHAVNGSFTFTVRRSAPPAP
jgi:methionine-rich copper-binding protein CopC